jgi:hypothetical protein
MNRQGNANRGPEAKTSIALHMETDHDQGDLLTFR